MSEFNKELKYMKILILSVLLLFPVFNFAQVVRIPDANFRQQLISLGYDTNDDGKIQVSEAKAVKDLDIKKMGIVNLEGINSFTNLKELDVAQNPIAKIDVSNIKGLTGLYAWDNPKLSEVNVTGLTKLKNLYVHNNGGAYGVERSFIRKLDVSTLTSLETLQCGRNLLTELDVSGLNNLKEVRCEANLLEKVSLTKAPNLKYVKLENNPLKITVDIRGLVYLEYFDCEKCELLFLNMSGTVNLKELRW
jgi:protein phosphatase 1 regulatory subunit 7